MKIKSITIEGLHNVLEKKYDFQNLNYLYGPNGAGKSTVLQAIQLALLGYIPGVNKTNAAISKHARGSNIVVKCELLDEKSETIYTITRSWTKTGKSVSSHVSVEPEGFEIADFISELELPVYNFNSFMSMSANDLKKWFISFLPNSNDKINWDKELTEALGDVKCLDAGLKDRIIAYIDELRKTGKYMGADLVKEANKRLKDEISLEKSNLDRIQKTSESLIMYDDCNTTDVEGIQAEISKLQSQLAEATQIESIKRQNQEINKQIESLEKCEGLSDEDKNKISSKVAKIDSDVGELAKAIASNTSLIATMDGEISAKNSILSSKGICPYSRTQCDAIVSTFDTIQAELDEIRNKSKELKEKVNQTKQTKNAMLTERAKLMTYLSNAERQEKQLNYLRSQLQMEKLIDGESISTEDILTKLNELNSTLTKAAANKKYNELSESITANKFMSENTIKVLKIWETLTGPNGLQNRMMVKPFEDISNDITKYLRKMFDNKEISCKFILEDKANSFSFGLERDDKYIAFEMLSSGEKCLYTLALMMCLSSRAKSPLKLIMIDDLLDHLDDAKANKLIDALSSIHKIQIILAGVQKFEGKDLSDVLIEVK